MKMNLFPPETNQFFEVHQSTEAGRYLAATRAFCPGDVILTDKPLAWSVGAGEESKRCHLCLQPCPKLLRCSSCKIVRMCSKECQRNAWPIHRRECHLLKAANDKSSREPLTSLPSLMLLLRLALSMAAHTNDAVNSPPSQESQAPMQPYLALRVGGASGADMGVHATCCVDPKARFFFSLSRSLFHSFIHSFILSFFLSFFLSFIIIINLLLLLFIINYYC